MTLQIKKAPGSTNISVDAKKIRESVFVLEQHISTDIEFDNQDANSTHYVGYLNEHIPVTTARVGSHDNVWHIGRVATMKAMRQQGLAKQLMERIITDAKTEHISKIELGAQIQACNFYQRLGFVQVGEIFMEAGIEHIQMELIL